jgi:hypothetical protein
MKTRNTSLISATTFALLLSALFISDNSLSAQALNTQEKNSYSRRIKGLNFVKKNQPSFISQGQIIDYAYDCRISVEQTNTAPPTANYRASLSCTVGSPYSFVLSIYNANVNFPGSRKYIGPNNFTCPSGLSCTTPSYSRVIDKTQHFIVSAGVNIRGSDGLFYTLSPAGQTRRTYNDRGVAYPLIKPTRTDMLVIPFPEPPFADYIPRDADFRAGLTQIYTTNQWTIPPNAEAHHIKPISWGGSNDPQANGVFLGSTTHSLFTGWWASFSNLNW